MSRYATDSLELVEVLNFDIHVQALTARIISRCLKWCIHLKLCLLSAKIFKVFAI